MDCNRKEVRKTKKRTKIKMGVANESKTSIEVENCTYCDSQFVRDQMKIQGKILLKLDSIHSLNLLMILIVYDASVTFRMIQFMHSIRYERRTVLKVF